MSKLTHAAGIAASVAVIAAVGHVGDAHAATAHHVTSSPVVRVKAADPAYSGPMYAADVDRIDSGVFYVAMADGSTYVMRGCRTPGSKGCVWDAARRGHGRSFVQLAGRRYYFRAAA